jgi:PAS domain S-box-containing protein
MEALHQRKSIPSQNRESAHALPFPSLASMDGVQISPETGSDPTNPSRLPASSPPENHSRIPPHLTFILLSTSIAARVTPGVRVVWLVQGDKVCKTKPDRPPASLQNTTTCVAPEYRSMNGCHTHPFLIFAALLLLGLHFRAVGQPALPTLITNLLVARSIDRSSLPSNGIPTEVEAVVTYIDPEWGMMMVAQGTNGIFVTANSLPYTPGDLLQIRGSIIRGEFAPSLDASPPGNVARIGTAPLPAPFEMTGGRLLRGQEDAQRIRIQAILGQSRIEPDGRNILHLVSEFGEFTAYLPPRSKTAVSTNRIGSQLTLVGVCGTEFNALGQYLNFNLFLNTTNDIQFNSAEPTPPFELPVRNLRDVFSFRLGNDRLQFVRVEGTVTHAGLGFCILQNNQESIRMRNPPSGARPAIGQQLDLVGIPQPDQFGPILTACQFRVLSSGNPPQAQPLSTQGSIQYNKQNGLRVLCEGVVRLANSQSGMHTLSLQRSPGESLDVVIHSTPSVVPPLEALEVDARLRVVGVLEPETTTLLQKSTPRILVASWDDVSVLQISPSTRIHRIATFSSLTALVVLAISSVVIIRRLRGQDDALREHQRHRSNLQQRYDLLIERAVDLIYTLDQNGRVLSLNQAALRFFGVKPHEARGRSVLDIVVPEHRETVRSRMQSRLAEPESESPFQVDVFDRAGDRRTLEITSRIVLVGEATPQIEGVARDITARRRIEEALRALVATAVSGSGEAFFQRVVRCIGETLNVDYALVGCPSATIPDTIETLAVWALGKPAGTTTYPVAGSPCAEVLERNVLCIHQGLQERFPNTPILNHLSADAYIGYRLHTTDGRSLGTLAILHRTPFHPTQYQLQLLEILAARVGAEIDRLRTEAHSHTVTESLRRTNVLLLNLNRHHIHGSADLSRMLETIAGHAVEGIHVARVSVWLISPDRRALVCAALVGPGGPLLPVQEPITVSDHPAYFAAIETERFISVLDAQTDPRTRSFAAPYLIPLGITSMLDGPIRIEGHVVGSLCVEHIGPPRVWTEGETHLAGAMADMASVALQTNRRAGAERELDRRTRLLQNLAKLSRAMLTVDSADSAIGAVIHGIGPATNGDRCYFFARHTCPTTGRDVVSQRHEWCAPGIPAELPNPVLQNFDIEDNFPRWVEAFDRGEPICGSIRSFPRPEMDILEPQGILSLLAVPVVVGHRWVGFIGFDACREERHWERYEIDLLTTIASDLGRSLEQWATKRALQEKEIHYESVVEVLAEGVMVAERSGRFTRANANASRILGHSAEQLRDIDLHSTTWSVIREDGSRLPNHEFPALRTLLTGEPCTGFIMGIRRPDGDRCWISANTRPLPDPATGEVNSVVISFVDITESRRNRLELERARDAAEASNRAKADFLTIISHEVRTPLNAVLGYADLLEQEIADADLRHYVRTIRQSGENLLEIINEILDFSKLEAGRLKLESEPCDLLEVSFAVAELLSERAASKGLALGFDWHPEVPRHISGDAGRIRQILTNLLGNAVKFTHSGHIVLSSRLLPAEPTYPQRIRIQVEDTGPGIPADKHSLLFQRFSMVDTSLTRRTGGTGLGLAISRQLAEAMGGTVGFASDDGKGSTFWFDLPLQPTSTPSTNPPAAPPGTRLILAVHSHLAARLITHQCRHWGIETSLVDSATGLSVLADCAASARPFAAVIAEAPLTPAIAKAIHDHELPFILLESLPHPPHRPEASSAPTLRRPFLHPDRLAGAIDAVLSPESRRPGGTHPPARLLDSVQGT